MPGVETLPRPEQTERYQPFRGAQVRFLLADQMLLNPDKTCPDEAFTQVKTFADRDYGIFERASVADRKQYWEQDHLEGQEAKRVWAERTKTTFNRAKNTAHFWSLSPLLTTLGVDTQKEEFNSEDIEKVWQRYFAKRNDQEPGGVQRFVEDILASYQTNGHIDQEKVAQAMNGISWFSNLFGKTAGNVVTQLIDAEVALQANSAFAEQYKAEANDLSPEEVELLNFLTKHRKPVSQRDQTNQNQQEDGSETNKPKDWLAIYDHEEEILKAIKNNTYTILIAGTGTGKTIGLPIMLAKKFTEGDKLVITEPTQINAADPAGRIAFLRGEQLGGKVGFQHGGGKNLSEETADTLIVTEGILLQQMRHDQLLQGITYLMFDDAQNLGKNTEELLEKVPHIQERRREAGLAPIKVIIASATIDSSIFTKRFPDAKIVDVPAKQYDVKEIPSDQPIASRDKPQAAARIVQQIIDGSIKGDILIAMKGQADMNDYQQALAGIPNLEILTFFSSASEEQKNMLKLPAVAGKRKVILATDAIQRGITIPNLVFMINPGEKFEKVVDSQTGLEYMTTTDQSIAECDQWKGRVGRLKKGYCYNLFTTQEKARRRPYPMPEMRKSDLTDVILEAIDEGRDIRRIEFLSSLPEQQIVHGLQTLQLLGAVDGQQRVTEIGKRMLDLPVDYHLARMIAEGEAKGIPMQQLYEIVAMVEAHDIIAPKKREESDADRARFLAGIRARFGVAGSDFLTYHKIWQEFHNNKTNRDWAEQNGLNYQGLMRAINIYNQRLRPQTQGYRPRKNAATPDEIQECIVAGYRDRFMKTAGNGRYQLQRPDVGAQAMRIDRESIMLRGETPSAIVATNNSRPQQSRQPGGEREIFFGLCQAA